MIFRINIMCVITQIDKEKNYHASLATTINID